MPANQKNIKAVTISLNIVQELIERDGARVTEVAEALDIAPSTAYNHLQTLLNEEYVINRGSIYYPSMEFLRIGEYARTHTPGYRKAKEQVKALAEESGGRTHFTIEEHGRGRYVYNSTGHLAVETFSSTGSSFPLHVSSAGKAMLAELPKSRVHEIIERYGLEASTSNSITDKGELLEELEQIRERGVAFNIEEHNMGINAVGAPVKDPNGFLLGALSISGPAQRFKGKTIREELSNNLLAAVNELELGIMYSQ
ncbi:IclR family transcriptional regulator [Halostagnicola kamekurae]|uniref:DNA-binding transcriptional regulator, IclR family n=1 Tax=Halostagnicola kamekurae TaxID=619731 RepID=A0A1I6UPR6_9EURY|nr:IclR family transcriptional regulator [Halostagnicola kamekurae]SFT03344.1 DNA-binding transcriptional regulator, IclR family [Halostagnicola kamekurae]